MANIVRFAEFRSRILDDLRSNHPGAEIRADESDATLVTDSHTIAVLSIDKLYRVYVDAALQFRDGDYDDLVAVAKSGINSWFAASGESPVFAVDRIPEQFGNLVLMQKCVGMT